jgi:hypothetical protein
LGSRRSLAEFRTARREFGPALTTLTPNSAPSGVNSGRR